MPLALSICLLVLAVLGHGYFWTDLVNRMHAWSAPRKLIDALTMACFLAFLVLPLAILAQRSPLSLFSTSEGQPQPWFLQTYPFLCSVWGFACLVRNFVYERVTDNPQVLTSWQREPVEFHCEEPATLFREGLPRWLSLVPYNEILRLRVDRKRLAIPGLDHRLEGLKLAHISDLHMTGRIALPWFEFVSQQVNKLNADAIFITGDIVEKESCWPWLADSIGTLRAPLGVYFILGNHDYYIDTERTKQLLEELSLICLSERWMSAEWRGVPVQIGGNELPWSSRAADFAGAPDASQQESLFRLAMLHSPDQLAWARGHNVNLALAGHTHGGQLRFPVLGPIISPSRYGTRFACGVFRQDQTVMHVTRGVTGKTPLRWNCPPEIALLELASA
ncbi:MAG: metallophosphoesterase [Planctomycetota bacterium]